MAKKLFVGGLSWDTTDDGLRQAFASYGEITEAKVITDRDTGRSRGFGFVTFAQDEDAKTAISRWIARALTARPLRLTRRRKRVLAEVADPAVVLGRSWRRPQSLVVPATLILDIFSEPPHFLSGRSCSKPKIFNEITDCLSGRWNFLKLEL